MEMRFQHLFVAATIIFNLFFFVVSSDLSVPHELEGGLRGLKSFKEKASGGSNITFDCSPSGPCVPCLYSEKKQEIYRCSETGYRIPMKCVKLGTKTPLVDDEQNHKSRNTLENINEQDSSSSNIDVGSEVYVTYRSCITAVNEENLSVLGFETRDMKLLPKSVRGAMKIRRKKIHERITAVSEDVVS